MRLLTPPCRKLSKTFIFSLPMRAIHNKVREVILAVVDFFYPLFRKVMPLQTYRYAACGGGNTLTTILIFYLSYHYLFEKQIVRIGSIAISPHIASFLVGFCFSFPVGFYLSMYVVFQGSFLRRRVQLIRYFMVAIGCIILNYFFLKLFVEVLGWYPTPSMIATTVIVVVFSYLSQKHFSFKRKKLEMHLK